MSSARKPAGMSARAAASASARAPTGTGTASTRPTASASSRGTASSAPSGSARTRGTSPKGSKAVVATGKQPSQPGLLECVQQRFVKDVFESAASTYHLLRFLPRGYCC
jgi:hypothetical protein